MKTLFRKKMSNKGWTLIELMMVVSIIGLITPALLNCFAYCYQGMASAEMHLSLKSMNESILLHLHERMNSSKHMFQNNASSGGLSFIGQIQMSSAPASVSFSQMPQAQNGVTQTFSPNAGAVSSCFGDCLFYAAYDASQTIGGNTYLGPITVGGPFTIVGMSNNAFVTVTTAAVVDGTGKAVTMNLDVYRFYYDYLSSAGDNKTIPGISNYWLIEWQSVQYVDAFELSDINSTDNTLYKNVITWLTTTSNFLSGQAITLAWDPSQTAMNPSTGVYAFYTLSGNAMSGYNPSSNAIHYQNYTPLSRTNTGLVNNFNYGISGNFTNLQGNPPPPTVPMFCPPTSNAAGFPGGFEVGLEGANAGMQMFVRTLLIAHGNNKGYLWDNQTSVNGVRDVW